MALMQQMRNLDWPYPGACWWKFDFHTHTPASADTYWARNGVSLSPDDWLLRFMPAEIDCVAVTDHNSGEWIDRLQHRYSEMKALSDTGTPINGFRPLTLFPGVELSVHGGFHLLAIFDPSAGASEVDELLGSVEYEGTPGNSDGVTRKGGAAVVNAIITAGAIPIPAHADADSGLLRLGQANSPYLDANTIRQVLNEHGLLAVEWRDMSTPVPTCAESQTRELARVLGSDCHSFQGSATPGERYSWVKMADPTVEGLRLALVDGNGVSIKRSDGGQVAPPKPPKQFITRIEIRAARYMGMDSPFEMRLTPLYNALIGGRGTGKSTVVHALRLGFRRNEDLGALGDDSEPALRFRQFLRVAADRSDDGALRKESEIRVELIRDGETYLLRWRHDGQGAAVERQSADGSWEPSRSGAITPERFPIRLLSQGQIAEMAGKGRRALLDVVDEAANISELIREFQKEGDRYRALSAEIRAMDRELEQRAEIERQAEDLDRKIDALKRSEHAQVLQANQQALRQRREIDQMVAALEEFPGRIGALADDLFLDDWPDEVFDDVKDRDVIEWRAEVSRAVARARESIADSARVLSQDTAKLVEDKRVVVWAARADEAHAAHGALQSALAEQGVGDPSEFNRLVRNRHHLATQLQHLDRQWEVQKQRLEERKERWERLCSSRRAITEARSEFIAATLATNKFVRMEVDPYGSDIESSLRDLIDVHDDRFLEDVMSLTPSEDSAPGRTIQQQTMDRESGLQHIKVRLIEFEHEFGGRFRNYLQRKHRQPEFADHVHCWFPEDDLKIEYSRKGDGSEWIDISRGSQGQRSAALLAFLLAFGDEPIIMDQPEDDLDNHLIYDLIVRQISENKLRRQLLIVTHSANVDVNGDAELVHALDFRGGQCRVVHSGALQDRKVREEVCQIMEGGRTAFERRWVRLGRDA